MKFCLQCSCELTSNGWICPQCGWKPELSNGINLFAPEISGATESYDPVWYGELASLEINNFWFVSRNNLIRWLAKKHCPEKGTYLEVGCGTGFVLQMLHKLFPKWSVFATEAQPEGIQFAKKRVSESVIFFQMNACAIPFKNEFDVIGAFDVIEHISDDVTAIEQIYEALKPNGVFVVSVPQHMFLWSQYDEIGCHFRRYSALEIENKLKDAGFNVIASTSFNSLLLPLMMLSRYLNKNKSKEQIDVLEELKVSRWINYLLSGALKLELLLIKIGLNLPLGGSRIVIAKKMNRRN